jgi:hypothetical protein
MTVSQIATLMALPIAIICLIISIRAFYVYSLSLNNMIFVLGLAMAAISVGTFIGLAGDLHIAGNTFSTEWTRSFGACCGGLFIFLSSLMHSHTQMRRLKHWQIIATVLFVVVILLTPLYPPIKNPMISFALNSGRMVIYTCAFISYATLYASKSTRFSLIMCIGFLVLVTGYGLNIPGIFQAQLAIITIIAASIRIIAYTTLLVAYSIG